MNEYERLSRMPPEDLAVLIEIERRTALPRWLVWTILVAAVGFGVFNIVLALVGR